MSVQIAHYVQIRRHKHDLSQFPRIFPAFPSKVKLWAVAVYRVTVSAVCLLSSHEDRLIVSCGASFFHCRSCPWLFTRSLHAPNFHTPFGITLVREQRFPKRACPFSLFYLVYSRFVFALWRRYVHMVFEKIGFG